MSADWIQYNTGDRIARITMNRPGKRNALNGEMVSQLHAAFDRAAKDEAVKVIILNANGSVFSAGADLAYLQALQLNTYEQNLADSSQLAALLSTIYSHPKVIIALVQGHAIAGGCGLATVCDFIFSVPEALFGYTETKIGFIPAIVMFYLLRKIGESKSRELLLTGKLVNAAQALDLGMINRVIQADQIEKEATDFATSLCTDNAAESLRLTKQMINEIQGMSLEEGMAYAAQMNATARNTSDCQQGIAAFLNKEQIKW